MEEKQVSIGDETFTLPKPFFVFATQNPLEHEGTYPLPEAQLDRFFMKIVLTYPNMEDEIRILSGKHDTETQKIPFTIEKEALSEMQSYIEKHIRIDSKIYEYVANVLSALRRETHSDNATLAYGPSTRAGLALVR